MLSGYERKLGRRPMISESLATKSDNTIYKELDDLFVPAKKILLTEALSLRK